MTEAALFDPTPCALGEGPLWHPLREQLYWFDINAHRLHTRENDATRTWQFDKHVSAAGWVDERRIVIASETGLFLFDLETGVQDALCPIEADDPTTRSNDGRADPQGGFWFGTMGKGKEPGAGSIWRFYRGELRRLYPAITISNAICFAPSGDLAYYTDTETGHVWRQALDRDGWPRGEPTVILDLPANAYRPDGAVVDARGDIWIAQYGHARVVRFGADGREKLALRTPSTCPTCPAFGGDGLGTLYVTSARQGLTRPTPHDGQTVCLPVDAVGQAEHRVIL